MRLVNHFFAVLGLILSCLTAEAAGKASHVVLMVWDGMRPDFISEDNTPTLFAAARDGVTFLRHHPVYPSSTEVNAAALATGVYPGQTTIVANDEFRPAIDPLEFIETQSLAAVRKGDKLWTNHYLAFPTVSEILHDNGRRTAVAGTKPVALLHDRSPRPPGAPDVTLFAGQTLPEDWKDKLTGALGPFPAAGPTKISLDQWTTRALTGPLWNNGVPSFSLLWLAEPDYSQHKDGPGAPNPLKAIKDDDACLARVLQALKEKNALDSTDVIVLSDHGFSTVLQVINVGAALKKQGLHVFHKFPSGGPGPGDILLVSDGGVVLCYVTGHDEQLIAQAVHCLQAQPYTGVLFCRTPVAGTFPLADAHMDSPYAPDIVVTMRWTLDQNKYGAPGMMYCDRAYDLPNKGSHSTLCPTEMRNTCIAFGPDFARGLRDDLPTGNIDIAPTILWILGLTPRQPMSGRVLTEALAAPGPAPESTAPRHEEASWTGGGIIWRQYLDISVVNGVTYLDQGNASQETLPQPP